jgi:hypothetical protein
VSNRNEPVEVEVTEVIAETDKAILCVIDGEQVWIPTSQIDANSEVWKYGDDGALVIPRWLAEEKELT